MFRGVFVKPENNNKFSNILVSKTLSFLNFDLGSNLLFQKLLVCLTGVFTKADSCFIIFKLMALNRHESRRFEREEEVVNWVEHIV